MATEQDAARDRVLAARAELGEQFQLLEASTRATLDIPARVRRSPAKAAAIAGGLGFLALKGPQRTFGLARRIVRGPNAALPTSMLPDEIDRTLRSLGDDGDRVRGAIERDFAAYARKAEKGRRQLRTLVLLSVARPLMAATARAAAKAFLTPDETTFDERLGKVRDRVKERIPERGPAGVDETTTGSDPGET